MYFSLDLNMYVYCLLLQLVRGGGGITNICFEEDPHETYYIRVIAND